jgi:hypothetical protein
LRKHGAEVISGYTDAFGTGAAEEHAAADKAMPMWKRAIKYFFPNWKIT